MRLFALALAALAATTAPAKPAAQLFVTALDTTPNAAAETDIELKLPGSTPSVEVLVPQGYVLDLETRPGTVIGTARTKTASSLVAAGPSLWKATGLTIEVDRTDDGGYRLECRLDQPSVGDVDLDIQNGLTNPPGGVVTWRAFAGSIEVRSIVAFPQRLSAAAAFASGALHASGRLTFAGKPRIGVNVHLAVAARDDLAGARELGVALTRADGSWTFRHTLPPTRGPLTLIAYVNFYVASCPQRGCAGESIAPPESQLVTVRFPGARPG